MAQKKITKFLAGGPTRKIFYTDKPHYLLFARLFPPSQNPLFPLPSPFSQVDFDIRRTSLFLPFRFRHIQNGGRSVRWCHWHRFGYVSSLVSSSLPLLVVLRCCGVSAVIARLFGGWRLARDTTSISRWQIFNLACHSHRGKPCSC